MNKSVSIPFNKSLHGYWCSKVLNPPLEPILQQRIKINEEASDTWDDEIPWACNERASISILAGAVWRTNNLASEEFTEKKHSKLHECLILRHHGNRLSLQFHFKKGGEKWYIRNPKSWHKVLYGWQIVVQTVNRVEDLVINLGQVDVNA